MVDSREYHEQTDWVSKSMLSVFMDSRSDYRDFYLTKERSQSFKRTTEFGSMMHEICLEGRSLEDIARPYPDSCLKSNGAINSKPAREFEEECRKYSAYAVKGAELTRLRTCYDAVMGSALGRLIETSTEREKPVYWTDSRGLQCKCKPDFFTCMDENNGIIYDLKFSSQANPTDYHRVATRFKYWMQDAHYSEGVSQYYNMPNVRFVFFVVEDTFPHRIGRYEYPEAMAGEMRDAWLYWTDQLIDALDNDIWDDDWTINRGTVNTLYFDPKQYGGELMSLKWD